MLSVVIEWNNLNERHWKRDQIENSPSEAFEFLGIVAEAERGSLWSLAVKSEEDEDLSLPLIVLDVDGEDRSSCLSRTSLIRFRSTEATSALDPTPPRSLYIITNSFFFVSFFPLLYIFLDTFFFFLTNHDNDGVVVLVEGARVLSFSFFFFFFWGDDANYNFDLQTHKTQHNDSNSFYSIHSWQIII